MYQSKIMARSWQDLTQDLVKILLGSCQDCQPGMANIVLDYDQYLIICDHHPLIMMTIHLGPVVQKQVSLTLG